MMNNPMMQILQLMRNGGNPMTMLNQMTGNNPMVNQLMQRNEESTSISSHNSSA